MLVLIDELVNLYKIPNAITRQYNYEKILQMYNDTLQGKAQHLGIIMGGTPTSIEDRRRGVFSYEALRSRLTQGRFAREGMRDMLAPIIRLQPLTYEELLVLIEKLAQIHAGYFGYESNLDEGDLVNFLKIEFGRRGCRHAPHATRSHPRFHRAVGHHVPEPRCLPQRPTQRRRRVGRRLRIPLNTRDWPRRQ